MNARSALLELGEMLPKYQQTANRSLRETYAKRAKKLLDVAEKGINKNNPEEWAGFRLLRNQWIERLEYQFPEIQRPELASSLSSGLGNFCFGVVENTINYCHWYVVAIGILLYLLGRAHQKAKKRRAKKMKRRSK